MTVLKDITVAQSKYTGNDGKEKTRWLKIGEIHVSKDGKEYAILYPHINLAALPRKEGDDRLFANLFEPKPKEGNAKQQPEEEPPF